jgi:hypothetical protein
MKFIEYKKIKNGEGDFESLNAGELHKALILAIGDQGDPQKWYIDYGSVIFRVLYDKDAGLDLAEIDRVCKDHFKIDWSDFDPRKDKKDKQKIKLSPITTIAGLKTFIEEELL